MAAYYISTLLEAKVGNSRGGVVWAAVLQSIRSFAAATAASKPIH